MTWKCNFFFFIPIYTATRWPQLFVALFWVIYYKDNKKSEICQCVQRKANSKQILNSATKNVTVFRSKKTPQNFNNVFAASTKRRKSIKDTIIHREHTLLFFFFFTFLRFCLTLNNISVNHSGFQISAFFCRSDQTRDMNLL